VNEQGPPLLEVRGLTTEFVGETDGVRRAVRAVDGVDFEIGRGEILALAGESGSGKSATALSLVGLVPAPGRVAGGRVLFEGRDLRGLDERGMRRIRGARIGFVFQEPMTALNPAFTVGSQIAEALEVHGVARGAAARARAVELLDEVRIPDPARRAADFPHQLSGGMRQRALIAAAIACRPPLLIADEPTTALDATIQADILDLLDAMRRESGLSVLLITHDLGVVARVADRVAVMYAGRIVETGPARAVLESPAHPYTRGLLASVPGRVPGARLAAIPGAVPDLAALPEGCAFTPRCADRFEPCDRARPEATDVSPGHGARCHLYGGALR
jgi:peptide/nickel transport system ATP-binding protein/oligopeptide transport system ATP-binding protein